MKNQEAKIINLQQTNNPEITLVDVKIALKRMLMDCEQKMIEAGNQLFDIYHEIQNELGEGYSEPTLRKWTNTTNNEFPKLNQLATLSKFCKSRTAIDRAILYLQAQAKGLEG